MKGKKHGSKMPRPARAMLMSGGRSAAQTHGTHMPADEPIGRALKQGRSPGGKSSGGKKGRR